MVVLSNSSNIAITVTTSPSRRTMRHSAEPWTKKTNETMFSPVQPTSRITSLIFGSLQMVWSRSQEKRIVSFLMHHFASTLTVAHTTVAFPTSTNQTLSLVVPGLDTLHGSTTYVSPFQKERSSCLMTMLCQLSGKSNTTQMYSAAKAFAITSTCSFKQD
jgi:hypothetical protein